MKGCSRFLAAVAAFCFVGTLATAVLFVPLLRLVTERTVMKAALGGLDGALVESVPGLITQLFAYEARQQGLVPPDFDQALLETAVLDLFPPDWIDAQTDTAVEAMFVLWESGRDDTVIFVDTRPVAERIRGEPGRQLVMTLIASLPTCTASIDPTTLLNGTLPACLPANVPLGPIVDQLHAQIVRQMELTQSPFLGGERLQVPLTLPDRLMNDARVQRVRRFVVWANQMFPSGRWVWLPWLLPVGLMLLIWLLAVRSLRGWLGWTGWPVLLTAVFIWLLALLFPFVPARLLGTHGLSGVELTVVQAIVDNLRLWWLATVKLQAAVLLIIGCGLVVGHILLGLLASARTQRA